VATYLPEEDFETVRAGDQADEYPLWGTRTYWWCPELQRLAGAFCPELVPDRDRVIDWIHRLEALYYSLLLSSSQQSVDLALSALLGYPVADEDGVVQIDGDLLVLQGTIERHQYHLPSTGVTWAVANGATVSRFDRLTTIFSALPAPYLAAWSRWRCVYLWLSEDYDRKTLEIIPAYFDNDPDSVRVLDEYSNPLEFQFRSNGNLLIDLLPNLPAGRRTNVVIYYGKEGATGIPEEEFVEYDLLPATDFQISEEKDVFGWRPCDSCVELLVHKSLLEILLSSGYRDLLLQLGKPQEKYLVSYT
jgi:hypothetical protein